MRDVYNKLLQFENRIFDGREANSLIEIFNRRFKYEDGLYFAIELDENNHLVSLFWHDKKMLEDYILSRALVVFDMTYHMNKYDKIGSFV